MKPLTANKSQTGKSPSTIVEKPIIGEALVVLYDFDGIPGIMDINHLSATGRAFLCRDKNQYVIGGDPKIKSYGYNNDLQRKAQEAIEIASHRGLSRSEEDAILALVDWDGGGDRPGPSAS
jgi:hypothetical protein